MLPPSSRLPDNRNSLQRKKHFHLISTKHNINELNFLIKTFPDKESNKLQDYHVLLCFFFFLFDGGAGGSGWLFFLNIKQKPKNTPYTQSRGLKRHQLM